MHEYVFRVRIERFGTKCSTKINSRFTLWGLQCIDGLKNTFKIYYKTIIHGVSSFSSDVIINCYFLFRLKCSDTRRLFRVK